MKKIYQSPISYLLLLLSYCIPQPTIACTHPPPSPPPFTVDTCIGVSMKIVFSGFTTFGSAAGTNCACGLVMPSLISSVDAVTVVDASTGIPISQFTFGPNATTAAGFNAIAPGNWAGFSSGVSGPITAGIAINICYTVTVSNCNVNAVIIAIEGLNNAIGTAGANSGGTPVDHIAVSPSGAGEGLPVELTNFTGLQTEKGIELFWETETELNNDYFVIERSVNARDFEQVGQVAGFGNSNSSHHYLYRDEKPISGINYYRLKQVDYNDRFSYSEIIAVNNKSQFAQIIKAYPIPTRNKVSLVYPSKEIPLQYLTVYDLRGKAIIRRPLDAAKGGQDLSIDLTGYPAGVYQVVLRGVNGQLFIAKILLI